MSTIIKKQYETAKQILARAEFNLNYYDKVSNLQKDWDNFYNMVTSFLTIIGEVEVSTNQVVQGRRESGVSIIENCRQKFTEYEAELKAAGLIDNKPKLKNEDVNALQKIERMTEDDENQFFNRYNIEGYGI